ncbi:hypothetical protein BKA62DRAFT_674518 [Auriculariales sp. MPI-PUGE-AT-0066]|nr:hypothetical protein BKA62DRAFT_674518 [Auriculariales sp. MPI-PUGE-AT-0066]
MPLKRLSCRLGSPVFGRQAYQSSRANFFYRRAFGQHFGIHATLFDIPVPRGGGLDRRHIQRVEPSTIVSISLPLKFTIMGQTLSSIQDSLDERTVLVEDVLVGLKAAAEAKMSSFYQGIELGLDQKRLPIHHVLAEFRFQQCNVPKDLGRIQNSIVDLVADITGGHASDSLARATASIIHHLVGSSSGGIVERSTYRIAMDPLGGVHRLDQYYLAYTFKAAGVKSRLSNYVACLVVKSAVDVSALTRDLLRIVVNDSFTTLSAADRMLLFQHVSDAVLPVAMSETQVTSTNALIELWNRASVGRPVPMTEGRPVPVRPPTAMETGQPVAVRPRGGSASAGADQSDEVALQKGDGPAEHGHDDDTVAPLVVETSLGEEISDCERTNDTAEMYVYSRLADVSLGTFEAEVDGDRALGDEGKKVV